MKKNCLTMFLALALAGGAAIAPAAQAQTTLETRISALEARIHVLTELVGTLESQIDRGSALPAGSSETARRMAELVQRLSRLIEIDQAQSQAGPAATGSDRASRIRQMREAAAQAEAGAGAGSDRASRIQQMREAAARADADAGAGSDRASRIRRMREAAAQADAGTDR